MVTKKSVWKTLDFHFYIFRMSGLFCFSKDQNGDIRIFLRNKSRFEIRRYGASPSGKAAAFGAAIRGFESLRPSQKLVLGH